jgi:hypothetical protein
LRALYEVVVVYLVLGLAIMLGIVGCGCKLNRMEAPDGLAVAAFGAFVLVCGIIPAYAEASAISVVANLGEEDIMAGCQVALGKATMRETEKGLRNKYAHMALGLAAKFDHQAVALLDQHMCTEVCPCYQTERWATKGGTRVRRQDPEAEYGRLSEEILNHHNRTMNQDSKDFTPFLFVSDPKVGFISFMECFETWE